MSDMKLRYSTDYLLGGSLVVKNGRIDKFLFDGGYAQASPTGATTDNFILNYYNRDHLGNNREVIGTRGAVRQVTNYYPFGTPFTETADIINPDAQPYKYNGKELDRMHGLDTYDYGARQYYPILGRWDRMDPLCEKYYGISPYAYCANNPVRYIDIKGDSIFVLIAPDDAKGNGHMSVLIQNKENRWEYYSKNGTKGLFGLYGKPYNDNKGEFSFSSVDDFMNNNEFNPINEETNQRKYTEGYLIPSTSEEDVDAINGALSELEKNYFVVGSNCAVTVQKALSAAGKNTGNPSNYPLSPFTDNAVPITDYLIKSKVPNQIYRQIKAMNQGTVIKPRK